MRDGHMAQCEPCIQIKKKRIKRKRKRRRREGVSVRRGEEKETERNGKMGFSLLSKIYGNRAVDFCLSKKKS